jgi:hypothetical protein
LTKLEVGLKLKLSMGWGVGGGLILLYKMDKDGKKLN